MPNERLRAALLEHGLTPAAPSEQIGVAHKAVKRWVSLGRVPYQRHRFAVAARLAVDEAYLWPDTLSRGAGRSHCKPSIAPRFELEAVTQEGSDHVEMSMFGGAQSKFRVLIHEYVQPASVLSLTEPV